MENKDTNKNDEFKQKRIILSELSRTAEDLREQRIKSAESSGEAFFWASRTINYMLLNHIYDTNGASEFNTFNQWKKKGATILKGSKAFSIWGQPVNEQKQKQQEEKKQEPKKDTAEDYKYFPICYLFSDLQVRTKEERTEKAEPEAEQVVNEEMEILVI